MESRFVRTWKGTIFREPEQIWHNFQHLGKPEKAIYPNRKEFTFSAEKAIFPNMKGDALWGRQNNLDAISSVLATGKSEFSESETNRIFQLKTPLFRVWKSKVFRAPEQPWRNFRRLGNLKMRFFQTWKKSHFQLKKAIFPNLKRDAFSGRQNNLHAISSDMVTWKSDFSEPERKRFFSWKGDFSNQKGDAFSGVRTTLTQFRASRWPDKPIFRNLKDTALWAEKAIFLIGKGTPYQKEIASFSSKSDFSVSE